MALGDKGYLPNPDHPAREWQDIGGDLEARYDGKMYVDIRDKHDPNKRFIASAEALTRALELMRMPVVDPT